MDELARITRDFLRGQELSVQGNALMLQAFNALLRYGTNGHVPATGLFPTVGGSVPKPMRLEVTPHGATHPR